MLLNIVQWFLLVNLVAVYGAAGQPPTMSDDFNPLRDSKGPPTMSDDFNPLRDFKDLQSYLEFVKSMSSDPTVAQFLEKSKPETDIYDHVKAVMEQFAGERNDDIKYKSSVIIDQPNQPRLVNVYLLKDGETLTCELQIGDQQTLTDFQEFTLNCLGGQRFTKNKSK